jgi:hypothetical protein
MYRLRLVESPACDCGAEEQTMRHIVDDCPLGWIERDFFLELRVAWGLKN